MSYYMTIDGEFVGSTKYIEVVNPATEEVFAAVPRGSIDHADRALLAAKRSQVKWSQISFSERGRAVSALADAIAEKADEFARLITQEQGKPLLEAYGEVAWTESYLRHYATIELPDRIIQDDDSAFVAVVHKPLGVVVAITAWNFPLLVPCWKIAPAVIAGNSVVLKPSPTTPVTSLLLGQLCQKVFPAGVVNVITDLNDLGPYLVAHTDVAKISFTGSTATGKAIASAAGSSLKRITLELGGNDPAIVLGDVSIEETAQAIFNAAFLNCGQVCLGVKRVYVHRSIYDAMCTELARLADRTVLGDGMDKSTVVGPLQNNLQFEKIKSLIETARNEGVIIAGGNVIDRPGFFIQPTVVREVNDGDKIVDDEQFGPILPVVAFGDVDEVIERINAGPYGLGASVWSADSELATDIASRIDSGQVWVNQHIAIGPHIPMAGFKHSGIGVEQSVEGLASYTQIKVINVRRS